MKVSIERLFSNIIIFIVVFFRYLCMWNFIPSNQRYLLLIFALLAAIVYIARVPYSKKDFRMIVFIALFAVIDFITTGEIDILVSMLLAIIYSVADGDKKLVGDFARVALFFFLVTIILNSMGLISGRDTVRVVNGIVIERSSMGFTNVNHVFTYFISIVLGFYIVTDTKKRKKYVLVITLVASYILYTITNCRTGFFSVILLSVFIIFESVITKKISKYGVALFIVLTIVSYGIGLLFGASPTGLNEILTQRPAIYLKYIIGFPITLFGNSVVRVDNNYLWLIYRHGIVVYLFYLFIYIKSYKKLTENPKIFISVLVILIYSIFENMVNYAFNIMFAVELMYCINKGSNYIKLNKKHEGREIE